MFTGNSRTLTSESTKLHVVRVVVSVEADGLQPHLPELRADADARRPGQARRHGQVDGSALRAAHLEAARHGGRDQNDHQVRVVPGSGGPPLVAFRVLPPILPCPTA